MEHFPSEVKKANNSKGDLSGDSTDIMRKVITSKRDIFAIGDHNNDDDAFYSERRFPDVLSSFLLQFSWLLLLSLLPLVAFSNLLFPFLCIVRRLQVYFSFLREKSL